MSGVEVVDRGAREIVVFLSGDLNDEATDRLHAAVDEVAKLEQLNALDHVVVNMQHVTQLGEAGVGFLRELSMRGRRAGFEVSFAAVSAAAHRAVEEAGWSFVEHSPTLHERETGR
ncbi:anti-anti-sigma regulatory factor [Haloactinopolyspora alba]|uniref:Anti-anti-sigma regulatory factor n=1 Tax=Haloactinopolyspora alba TaxID=648780 RepID=A0A2P8DZ09_9ACTN|nr:STAS domain-containing protein [Haloactinopolyspora alba]PSL02455.1 anti-anti-sigma regulatory factor [Haloactinopolyspora alba]